MVVEVGNFTLAAVASAEAHEKFALMMMAILSIIGAVVGFSVSWWVMRTSVSKPLPRLWPLLMH
jgi:membrane protein DedA with SNARE-associated domain